MTKIEKAIKSNIYEKAMLFLVFVHCFTFIPFDYIGKATQLLFILGSLPILVTERKRIFKEFAITLLFLAIVSQILSWINSYVYLPEIANELPRIDRLTKLFSFIFIAYWLKGSVKNIYISWWLLVSGFIFTCFFQADFINELSQATKGIRVDFSIKNAQFTSMLSGLTLLISSFTLIEIIRKKPPFEVLKNHNRYIVIALTFLVMLISLALTLISQSRQVWLALLFVAFTIPMIALLVKNSIRKKYVILFYFVITSSILSLGNVDIVKNRLSLESKTVASLISGDWDNIPMTSIGIRVNSWIESTRWIKEHPIIGSDANAIKQVLTQSDKFSDILKEKFGHLHNYHIETLVAYGLLGLTIVYLLYYWVLRTLYDYNKVHSNKDYSDLVIFNITFVVFWFIINNFETFNGRSLGVYTHNIMLGGFYTFYLTEYLNKKGS
jgi:hypothetical protein